MYVLYCSETFWEMWTGKREGVGRGIRYMPIVVNFVYIFKAISADRV